MLRQFVRALIRPRARREFLLRVFSIRLPRKTPDFPPMIMIDTTTRCNMNCHHCPHSILARDAGWGGEMDEGLFRRIIDEIARENPDTVVRPFNSGEPLMRTDLERLIHYAKRRGIRTVSINSNGLLLTIERARRLIHSGLDAIEFSLDAATEATYRRVRNSAEYLRVHEQILAFLELKRRRNPSLQVAVSFVRQKENQHETSSFRHYWSTRVDRVQIREFHRHHEQVSAAGVSATETAGRRHPCPYLWDRLIIEHDGRVRFCEADWRAEHCIGDLRRQTIRDIWHSLPYQRLRDSHQRGDFAHPFCLECQDWPVIR